MGRIFTIYTLGLLLVILGLLLFAKEIIAKRSLAIFSPVPPFLTSFKNNQVSTLSLWLPSIDQVESRSDVLSLNISASASLIYDLTTQKVLLAKNPKKKLPMASLTKIMTAVVAIESQNIDDKYIVSAKDLVGENSMGLSQGEILSLEELLYGLILSSGNDSAEVLASNFPKGREEFISAMNNKAESLGLKNTHFTNPTGFEGDGDQFTTVYDLLVITRYAMRLPLFREVVGTFDYHIPYSKSHKEFYLENGTNLLTSYPGVLGVKDGFTPEAGLCLVTYLEFEGHKVIGILLGSDNRRQEMKDLLDYALEVLGITPPPHG